MYIAPVYNIKQELCILNGLIFGLNQNVIPEQLQCLIVKAAYNLPGTTENKANVIEEYYFPSIGKLV